MVAQQANTVHVFTANHNTNDLPTQLLNILLLRIWDILKHEPTIHLLEK